MCICSNMSSRFISWNFVISKSETLEVCQMLRRWFGPSFGWKVSGPISANLSDLFDLWQHDSKGLFFFGDLLKKPCGFRWRELTFSFKGRHMKSIWWKCGFVLFRYLTRYFFPSWFHRIIHQWLAPLNCPSWPWTVEGWGVDPVRVEANGPHPKRADTEIFFEETVGHTQTYNYRLWPSAIHMKSLRWLRNST